MKHFFNSTLMRQFSLPPWDRQQAVHRTEEAFFDYLFRGGFPAKWILLSFQYNHLALKTWRWDLPIQTQRSPHPSRQRPRRPRPPPPTQQRRRRPPPRTHLPDALPAPPRAPDRSRGRPAGRAGRTCGAADAPPPHGRGSVPLTQPRPRIPAARAAQPPPGFAQQPRALAPPGPAAPVPPPAPVTPSPAPASPPPFCPGRGGEEESSAHALREPRPPPPAQALPESAVVDPARMRRG